MNADEILDRANYLLAHFPHAALRYSRRKPFRRRPFLRVRFIQNRKVFFGIFHEKYRNVNKRDKARRYVLIPYLPSIFTFEKPDRSGDLYVYRMSKMGRTFVVVLKDIERRKDVWELYLYSIYPL